MNGVVAQFHTQFPQYKTTKVVVDWIPWGNRTTDWTNALTSGKGGPDITELGNTDTPGVASQGALANITSDVHVLVKRRRDIIAGNLANDTVNSNIYAVPWFGGVRGIWYNKDQFAKADISAPPTTWAQLVSDAKALMRAYPGTYGLGAPSNFTNAIVSFIWGAGGQVAVQSGGKWTAELNSPQSEAGIKFYADLLHEGSRLAGQVHRPDRARRAGRDVRRQRRGLRQGHPGHVHRRSLGRVLAEAVSTKNESQWASFPIPSENGPNPAPAFAGGSDLGVWAKSPNQAAAWDLISVMDSPSNATTFANSQGFFPEFTSQLSSGVYTGSPIMSGFAKAAGYTQISPLNTKNWATADATDQIIPNMMKALMQGANFTATVNKANTELQNVLNTGSET